MIGCHSSQNIALNNSEQSKSKSLKLCPFQMIFNFESNHENLFELITALKSFLFIYACLNK